MAKKGFIKDLNNIEMLPITRGELVLDSSGKLALHSNEFLATDSLPGLMSKEDKAKLDKLNENGATIDLVSATTDGLAPKIGTAAASTVTTQADEWVLTSTKGATPTWRKLPTNAFLNYYRPILVNGTSLLGNNNTALNIAAGNNINLTTDAGKVTINNGLTKLSLLTDDILSGKYLPLTGGELEGSGNIVLRINTSSEDKSVIGFKNGSISNSVYFGIVSDGTFKISSPGATNWYKIWHSGNDGEGSGLDADTLDGYHRADIIQKYYVSQNNSIDLNDLVSNTAIVTGYWAYVGSNNVSNLPWDSSAANIWTLPGMYNLQIAKFYNSNDIRVRGFGGQSWTSWKQIAFTDSDITGNAASADKVKNSLILKINSGSTEGTNKYTYDGSTAKTINIIPKDGIGYGVSAGVLNLTNAGVRSIDTGTTNGTISVNTNGTSADVAVKGLGSAAYTKTSSYIRTIASDNSQRDVNNLTDNSVTHGYKWTNGTYSSVIASVLDLAYLVDWRNLLFFDIEHGKISYRNYNGSNKNWSTWRDIAFTDSDITGNAATADKLKTKVQLWGNEFDGSNAINSSMWFINNSHIYMKDTSNNYSSVLVYNSSNTLALGYGSCGKDHSTNIYGSYITFLTSTDRILSMIITKSGNVGIGTTTPSSKLDVSGTLKCTQFFDIRDSDNIKNRLTFQIANGVGRLYTYSDDDSTFRTLYLGRNDTKAIVVTGNGNVGIGTDNPLYKLDVNGSCRIRGSVIINNNLAFLTLDVSGNVLPVIQLNTNNNLRIGSGTASYGHNTYVSGNNLILTYGTSNTTGMILNPSGNITIGDSDLAGTTYKLYVNGNTNINGSLTASTFLGNLDWSYITNKPNYYDRFPTLGHGVEIPSNADLNTETYLNIGTYYCRTYTISTTLVNNPVRLGFIMHVYYCGYYNPNTTYQYRVRKITTHLGEEWIQHVHSSTTAGEYIYEPWKKTARTDDTYPTSQITALTGYTKATSPSDLVTTDTLNTALGKLEYKAGIAYSWYRTITEDDTDEIINKWDEVVDFVNNLEVDLLDEFVTRKTNLTITGLKTFTNKVEISRQTNVLLQLTSDQPVASIAVLVGTGSNTNTGYFVYRGGTDYQVTNSGWSAAYTLLHSGNSNIKNGVITINGNTITPLTLHLSLSDYVTLNTSLTISGLKTFNNDVYIVNNKSIHFNDSNGEAKLVLGVTTSNTLLVGHSMATSGYNTAIRGQKIYLQTSSSMLNGLTVNEVGNVGILQTSPKCALDVFGEFRMLSDKSNGQGIVHKILVYKTHPYGLITRTYGNGNVSLLVLREADDSETFNLLLQPLGGNVGIGKTTALHKLDVNGTIRTKGIMCNSVFIGCDESGTDYTLSSEINRFNGNLYLQAKGDLETRPTYNVYMVHKGGKVGIGTSTINSNALLHVNGNVLATKFIKSGGTSSQFLKADGSVDNNAYLPLTGGTLTGPLKLKSEQYNGNYALDMSNSDIVNVNAIFTRDLAEAANEGLQFSRGDNTYDSIWCRTGVFYFSPNGNADRKGTYNTNYTVIHSGNYSDFLDSRYYTETEVNNKLAEYLPLSGGTMTGKITMNTGTGIAMKYNSGSNDPWIYPHGAVNYGIRYFEGTSDKMTLSASGNNNDITKADLCINGNGDGTVTIRGNTVLHSGNYNAYLPVKLINDPGKATLINSYGLNANYGSSSYGHPTEEYLQAFSKYLLAKAAGYTCIGYINPNSRGAYICDIYNNGTNSTTKLPEHITGHYFPHGGNHNYFGTSYGTWYFYTALHNGNYTTYADSRYVNTTGDTMTGALTLSYATSNNMTYASTNPLIVFAENGGQPVKLIYTDYDTYRAPAGLKVIGSESGAWFEVDGHTYAAGFVKTNSSDSYVLLGGGGHKALSTMQSEYDSRYVNVAGDTMTGLLTITSGGTHRGIKAGNTYINAIDGNLILQNLSSIRFGGDSWDYDVWAGLKYRHDIKTVYLGLADKTVFTANNEQSGGKLYLPGISNIYTGNGTNLVWHAGNDGAGSGLDADMLDSYHRSNLYASSADWFNAVGLTQSITVGGDSAYWYPVVITCSSDKQRPTFISIWKDLGSVTPSIEGNHSSGTSSLWLLYEMRSTHWDGNGGYVKTWYKHLGYGTLVAHARPNIGASGLLIVWLRGGTCLYYISCTNKFSVGIYYSSTNISGSDTYPDNVDKMSLVDNGGIYVSSVVLGYGNISGTAAKADSVTVTNSDYNYAYRMVWHSGNFLHSTAGIYCNPSSDSIYASFMELTRTIDHGLKVGSIRGTAVGSRTGLYIHMYERVHIGSPNGWGSSDAPTQGLSTYGGAWLATNNGNVGIGTTSPSYKLHVVGTSCISSTLTMGGIINTCLSKGSWITGKTEAAIKFNSLTAIDSSSFWRFYNMKSASGNVICYGGLGDTIGFYGYYSGTTANLVDWNLTVNTTNGNWTASASLYAAHFYENSDEQLKTNIQEIINSDKMPIIKEFDWKEDNSHSYGLIALELEEQGYSELVSVKDDGYKTVNYSAALSLIVGKLQVKIKELEKEIENLKNKN